MNETQQAELLAAWLAQGGGPLPDGLDADVVEAMLALRPELAPPPALTIDEVLAGVSAGPLAARPSVLASAEEARVPAPANRRGWLLALGGVLAAALVAIAVLPEPMSPADPADKRDAALAEPVVADVERAPAPAKDVAETPAEPEVSAALREEKATTPARQDAPVVVGGLGMKGSGEGGGGAGYGSGGLATSTGSATRARNQTSDADRSVEAAPPQAKAAAAPTAPPAPEAQALSDGLVASPPPPPAAAPTVAAEVAQAPARSAPPTLAKKESARTTREVSAAGARLADGADADAEDAAMGSFDEREEVADAAPRYADVRAEAARLANTQPLQAARMLEPWIATPVAQGQSAALDAGTWALKAGDRVYAAQLLRAGLALGTEATATRKALVTLLAQVEQAP